MFSFYASLRLCDALHGALPSYQKTARRDARRRAIRPSLFSGFWLYSTIKNFLLLDRLAFAEGHRLGMTFIALGLDGVDAGLAIGAEEEGEDLRDGVIELLAVHGLRMGFAVGTAGEGILGAAGPDLAPTRFFVLLAAGAFSGEEFPAGPAIEAAVGDEFLFGDALFFHLHSFATL
jgi:hypothetical protein